jgi:hypothetical protein
MVNRVNVKFSPNQWDEIVKISQGRQDRAMRFGRKPRYFQSKSDTSRDGLLGVMGEYAIARYFRIFYDGNGEMPDDDDVAGCQVRATYYPNGRLILHESAPKNRVYILVYASITEKRCELIGWVNSNDVMNRFHWTTPKGFRNPCYIVNQSELRDINRLVYRNGLIQSREAFLFQKRSHLQ